eukprot:jgi/Botrbrau1/11321/Bobra.0038s0081.1
MVVLDVAIVGAGPGGLATANALLRAIPNVNLKVYEGSRRMAAQGAGVLLNVNGLAALEAINPAIEKRMASLAWIDPARRLDYGNLQGEPEEPLTGSRIAPSNFAFPPMYSEDFKNRYGKNPFVLGWHEIRNALAEPLPPETVQMGSKVLGYEENKDDTVTLQFQEGREEVRARILIGADGYFSRIRQGMLGDGPPTFQNAVSWRARVPHGPGLPSPSAGRWWREDYFRKRWAVIYAISDDLQCIVLRAPVANLQAKGLTYDASQSRASIQGDDFGPFALERCQKVFEDADPRLVNILENVLDPSTVTEHGVYSREPASLPDEAYGRGRVALVGDAAHCGPVNGQGLNLAMEDAAVLAFHLRKGGLTPLSLRRYEAERAPRVKEIIRDVTDVKHDEQKERLLWLTRFLPLRADPHGGCVEERQEASFQVERSGGG